jgi:hypothetical protein
MSEVTGGWINYIMKSFVIFKVVKSKRITWARCVARIKHKELTQETSLKPGGDNLRKLCTDRIILKQILQNYDMRLRARFI